MLEFGSGISPSCFHNNAISSSKIVLESIYSKTVLGPPNSNSAVHGVTISYNYLLCTLHLRVQLDVMAAAVLRLGMASFRNWQRSLILKANRMAPQLGGDPGNLPPAQET